MTVKVQVDRHCRTYTVGHPVTERPELVGTPSSPVPSARTPCRVSAETCLVNWSPPAPTHVKARAGHERASVPSRRNVSPTMLQEDKDTRHLTVRALWPGTWGRVGDPRSEEAATWAQTGA